MSMDKGYVLTNRNKRRAKWAMAALETFAEFEDTSIEGEKLDIVSDLMSDLMHLAAQKGWGAKELISRLEHSWPLESDGTEDEDDEEEEA